MFNGLDLTDAQVSQLNDLLIRALSGPAVTLDPKLRRDVTGNSGVTVGLGLTGISLESPAKMLYPVPTPLRNMIPRQVQGGIDYSYRQITDINQAKTWGSVGEAKRNTRQKFTEANKTVSFRSYGMDNALTQEAQFGGQSSVNPSINFQPQAFATLACLQAAMIVEELIMLGGNLTALGAPATPTAWTVQPATGRGSLTASTTYHFKVSALTEKGYFQGATGRASANSPGETTCSADLSVTTAAGGSAGDTSVGIQWAAKTAAVAYNVYAYTSTTVRYVATVFTNKYEVKALGSSTNVANTTDMTDPTVDVDTDGDAVYQTDGMIALLANSTTGYNVSLDGAALTGDSTTGVAEIDTMLKDRWDNYKISPDLIIANSAHAKQIDKLVLGSAAPVMRVDLQAGASKITGGISVAQIKNRYYNDKIIPILVHPNIPPGLILAPCFNLGEYYPNANIANNFVQKLAFEYARLEFARTKRQDEFGVYASGALAFYAAFAGGILTNVATS